MTPEGRQALLDIRRLAELETRRVKTHRRRIVNECRASVGLPRLPTPMEALGAAFRRLGDSARRATTTFQRLEDTVVDPEYLGIGARFPKEKS